MEVFFHNDIIRFGERRYRVSSVTDTEYTITRPLNRGAVEEITVGRGDRRLRSFPITEMELRRYGFEKLKNGKMHNKGVMWRDKTLWVGRLKIKRPISSFHVMQHILMVYMPNFKWEYRMIPRKVTIEEYENADIPNRD